MASVTEVRSTAAVVTSGPVCEDVLRGEPFGIEHLEVHARALARHLTPQVSRDDGRQFKARFEDNARLLRAARDRIALGVQEGEPLTSDAEWLLDNFHIVEEQLREIVDDLPPRYYVELPKLASGEPRIYPLALELLIHTDSALTEELIVRYFRSFQTLAPLSIGETWAVPIMLRLGLVENLRRIADQLLAAREARVLAEQALRRWPGGVDFDIDMSSLTSCSPIVLQVIEQLHDFVPGDAEAQQILERQLARYHLSLDQVVHHEHCRQAANQVSIGNVITSMRLISSLDWVNFFEQTNLAEAMLRRDPAHVYASMDFRTRDRYRHAAERISKGAGCTDLEAATHVIELAATREEPRERHIGFFLLDAGLPELEARLKYRVSPLEVMSRGLKRHSGITYFGSILGLTAVFSLFLVWLLRFTGLGWHTTALMSLLGVPLAAELAVQLTNLLVTSWLSPRLLPKLEFKEGVPEEWATFVVMPVMLSGRREIDALVERLELHFLANPERSLRFALLSDFSDAPQEQLPGDADLLEHARRRIEELNQRYQEDGHEPFVLFHRARRWNPAERLWMGWERKRGKLQEFNQLLRGDGETSYLQIPGCPSPSATISLLPQTRFVITLDADTQLPYGTARRLIGALAHPLNRPRFDATGERIVGGYALLQPRLIVDLGSANRSRFAQIVANSPGIDPYATCASDVYQDLFEEGSFTGKGIYDLDAIERTLGDAFPQNHILSHDLIEGCHARTALVSDMEMVDGAPNSYHADVLRQHRWVRGDWQLLPWLLPRVPATSGWRRNRLSLLSRWKIFDNLRRSLVAPLLVVFLLAGWWLIPQLGWLWTAVGLVALGFPLLVQILWAVSGRFVRPVGFNREGSFPDEMSRTIMQFVIAISLLPHKAVLMLDAIGRTLYRLTVSRRKLLEWETAAATEKRLSRSSRRDTLALAISPLLAVCVVALFPPAGVSCATLFLIAWASSPFLVRWLDRPATVRQRFPSDEERHELRLLARRTWAFFENVVGPEDNWLPPDNLQEYPREKLAHRVSPTNEGLYLVSAVVARDFGFLSLHELAELLERNLATWQRFERLHGHFYNWYETTTLEPLLPRYLSTVDSGNLAAAFLTVRQAIDELCRAPVFGAAVWQGLLDTVEIAEQSCDELQPTGARLVSPPLDHLLAAIRTLRKPAPSDLYDWTKTVAQLNPEAAEVELRLSEFVATKRFPETDVAQKVSRLASQARGLTEEWQRLFAWWPLLFSTPVGETPAGKRLREQLAGVKSLAAIAEIGQTSAALLKELHAERDYSDLAQGGTGGQELAELERSIVQSATQARDLIGRLRTLGDRVELLAREMDFSFLYNPARRLFSIGYNLEESRLDRAHYDMLCSEARLASYLAIAKGDVEYRHWFQLGRPMTRTAGSSTLLSWGGTMFEYLMPALFQKTEAGSILDQSSRVAVARQAQYGKQHSVPWGISESAFGALAVNADYHYQSFGVPGLGLKRGLAKDMVVSPYSTLLALEFDTAAAISNLRLLTTEHGAGWWGYYDAIDYTPDRVPPGKRSIIVRCYMSHHQGMGLVAIGNLLLAGNTRRRFHSHPLGKSCELLLQERIPAKPAELQPHGDEVVTSTVLPQGHELVRRRVAGLDTGPPRTHLLSNGRYAVMLTQAGSGSSRSGEIAVTRWRSDSTCDPWGQFIYLRDLRTGRLWSAGYQPTRAEPDAYEVVYSIDKVEYLRRDGTIETHMEVAVSPENNAEIRQIRLTNHSLQTTEIEITSYAEIVLTSDAADLAHPAFQNLFVQTEFVPGEASLLAWRRPRNSTDPATWCVHVLSARNDEYADVQFETSRQAFLGRRGTVHAPRALSAARLHGREGTVLDPIFSLRCRVTIRPEESATVAFVTAQAGSRDEALLLADQYHDPREVQRTFELAWAYSQVELRHLQISPAVSHLFQRLASPLLYPDAKWRAPEATLRANRQGQSALWRYGISGDVPLFLVRLSKPEQVSQIQELLQAHEFWRRHGLKVDLAILNDYPGSYFDAVHEQLLGLITSRRHTTDDRLGKVYLLRGAQISQEDQLLLEASAAVNWSAERGTIARQVEAADRSEGRLRPVVGLRTGPPEPRGRRYLRDSVPSNVTKPSSRHMPRISERASELSPSLIQWNGFGGFRKDGLEYRIAPAEKHPTPRPWTNVIANPGFGCLITESGGGYTWAGNSREYKLTTWSNDPVSDPPSEILLMRNEQSGEILNPMDVTALRGELGHVDHGAGYSRFESLGAGLRVEVTVSIAADAPVKFIQVTLENRGSAPSNFTLAYYAEWVLGVNREQTQAHVTTSIDHELRALLARNPYHPEMPERVTFLTALEDGRLFSGSRAEFIGRYGSIFEPARLKNRPSKDKVGAGLDPCGVVITRLDLQPGQRHETAFLLGSGTNVVEARRLIAQFGTLEAIRNAVQETRERWDRDLSTIQVHTPLRSLDLLVNRWLLYQTLSCRMWGRAAFYQCGGAFGFRDQLQDSMALVYSRPDVVREHLLLAASRQFEEGDVQHWWHPPTGRGTRTRYSDDALWLPLAASHYAKVTGDDAIWDVEVPFLHSQVLEPHEEERYELPAIAPTRGTLYEHCRRTFVRAFRTGAHGLPLMGGGDWNDGMNKVGILGQGESVWLGWFLLVVADAFLPWVQRREHAEAHEPLEKQLARLREALEAAWDGQWYRRAYFDDGTPLGSQENEECRIDSIAQSWAVLAGANPSRSRQALESVWHELVRHESGISLLFAPPFDQGPANPGYIKGYPPGIRENGGQYTHAALWLVKAFATLGDAERAMKLLQMLNPLERTGTRAEMERYQVEPYVVAADIYSVAPHEGRGGWTWYTGSAAWMYRVALEDILGFHLQGNHLRMAPCIPANWSDFEITYRRGASSYRIQVVQEPNDQRAPRISIDGEWAEGSECELPDDGRPHEIIVSWRQPGTGFPPVQPEESALAVNGNRRARPILAGRDAADPAPTESASRKEAAADL